MLLNYANIRVPKNVSMIVRQLQVTPSLGCLEVLGIFRARPVLNFYLYHTRVRPQFY